MIIVRPPSNANGASHGHSDISRIEIRLRFPVQLSDDREGAEFRAAWQARGPNGAFRSSKVNAHVTFGACLSTELSRDFTSQNHILTSQ
jgi:hypothetical protein